MLPGKMTAGIAVVHEPCWFRTAVFPLPVSNEGNVGSHWIARLRSAIGRLLELVGIPQQLMWIEFLRRHNG